MLKSKLRAMNFRARSLAWIRHQPSELEAPGSNPGAPAIFASMVFQLS